MKCGVRRHKTPRSSVPLRLCSFEETQFSGVQPRFICVRCNDWLNRTAARQAALSPPLTRLRQTVSGFPWRRAQYQRGNVSASAPAFSRSLCRKRERLCFSATGISGVTCGFLCGRMPRRNTSAHTGAADRRAVTETKKTQLCSLGEFR